MIDGATLAKQVVGSLTILVNKFRGKKEESDCHWIKLMYCWEYQRQSEYKIYQPAPEIASLSTRPDFMETRRVEQ